MRRFTAIGAAAVLFAFALPASAEMTVEQVIARHIEAHGGQQAWDAIETMRTTGTFTAFSKVEEFELVRKGSHYYWDTVMDGKKVVIGHDGNDLWWNNEWRGAGASEIVGIDEQVTRRELDYPTPFFGYEDKGYEVELIGESELEGIPAIAIGLTRPDESTETWYLDPDTHLEIGCESTGSDFGNPNPQLTFFDDFREVEGVKVAFLTEKQWYTRNRIMQIDRAELNVSVDDAIFAMPAPPGMGPLLGMAGTWKVKDESRQSPQGEFQESEREATIEAMMGRGMLREETTSSTGDPILRTWSFDRFKEVYRVTSIDGRRAQMAVLEGKLDDDGRLTVDTFTTGTPFQTSGFTVYVRASYFGIEDDGFSVETEVSIDDGETWWVASKSSYTRAE